MTQERCKACNDVGMVHCSDPTNCGGMQPVTKPMKVPEGPFSVSLVMQVLANRSYHFTSFKQFEAFSRDVLNDLTIAVNQAPVEFKAMTLTD